MSDTDDDDFNLDDIAKGANRSQGDDESTEQFPIRDDSDNKAQKLADTICAAFLKYELSLVQSSSFHSLSHLNRYKRDLLSDIDGYLCRIQAAVLPKFDVTKWQLGDASDQALTARVSAVAIEIVTYLKRQLAGHLVKKGVLETAQFYADLKVLIELLEQFSVVKSGDDEVEIEKLPDLSSAKELLAAYQKLHDLEVTAFSVNGSMDILQKALIPNPVSSEEYSCKVRTSPRDLSADQHEGDGDDGEEDKSPLSELLFTTSDKIALDLLRLKFSVMKQGLSKEDFSFERTIKDEGEKNIGGLVGSSYIGNKDDVGKYNLLRDIDDLLALLSKCNSQGNMDGVEFNGSFALTRAIIHKYYGLNRTPKEQGDFEKKLLKQTHDGVKITVDHNLSKMYLSLNRSTASVTLLVCGKNKMIKWGNGNEEEKNDVWGFIKWRAEVLGAPITRAQTISYALVKKYCDVSLNGESATIQYLTADQMGKQLVLDLKVSGRLWRESEPSKGRFGLFGQSTKGRNVIDVPVNSEAQDKTLNDIRKDISEKMQESSKESHYKDILRAFVNAVQKFEMAYRLFTSNLLIDMRGGEVVECTEYDSLKCVKQKDVVEKLEGFLTNVYGYFGGIDDNCKSTLDDMKLGETTAKNVYVSFDAFADYLANELSGFNVFKSGKQKEFNERLLIYLQAVNQLLGEAQIRSDGEGVKSRIGGEVKKLSNIITPTTAKLLV